MTAQAKAVTRQVAYRAGLSAEAAVARHYEHAGHAIQAIRWRGQAGEIDLIARDGDGLIFIEVKKSKNFANAARSLSDRQIARIYAAAGEYLGQMPLGQLTETRFDLAMVDVSGHIEVLENAIGF
ncbi:YraN family protein [Actibacterium sp. 188UL27-1]|uniref:YraN family protein n=1 Tax=Actibacterium sp. 188UL27-1 TaxID=2786961 RepID=UPI001956A2A0|nr:YraN family protein [Actibacterium sp. 188UL27-1]MBM7068124.1 YraN family protein [Actibacterium sp. 188UL27-1]